MAMSKRSAKPWCLEQSTLEAWYNDSIQHGTSEFDTDCGRAVDEVVQKLHKLCTAGGLQFHVDRVLKGGSLGKGTMVKDLSDVDLIAFINPPNLSPIVRLGPKLYKEKLAVVIRDLYEALKNVQFAREVSKNEFLINFKITVSRRCLQVDLLPTSDNCAGHGHAHSDMFRAMLQLPSSWDREFYSASLAEHQLKFVKSKPGYVKELIRLVKYWANDFLPDHLKKSYCLELITIHQWEEAGEPVKFSKAQGLMSVLLVLTRLTALRVTSWSATRGANLYDATLANTAIKQLEMRNPIVLDPANPTNNVCKLYQRHNHMQEISQAAMRTLQTDLLSNVAVRQGWKG